MASLFVGRTGKQLFLTDAKPPLLLRIADPAVSGPSLPVSAPSILCSLSHTRVTVPHGCQRLHLQRAPPSAAVV